MPLDDLSYNYYLRKPCDPEEIVRLSKYVFVEGHLEALDDLILVILPLAHIVYYKNIKYLDDREYAKEDLISDTILRLYQDMLLRWDKYIHVDSYYDYFKVILKNGMIGLVHEYHNYYSQDELDCDVVLRDFNDTYVYEQVEFKILKESLYNHIIDTTRKLLKCRQKNTNLLLSIFNCKYIKKEGLESLKSRVKVLGISSSLFNFYCEHVDYVYKLSYTYHCAVIGGKVNVVGDMSSTLDRFEDITYRMLSVAYYDTILPEIYAEFGPSVAKKFVKTFSNRTVTVPSYRDFCDNLLGGAVYSLAQGNRKKLYDLVEQYHMPYRTLLRIYNKAAKFYEENSGGKS